MLSGVRYAAHVAMISVAVLAGAVAGATGAYAEDAISLEISVKDHVFSPAEMKLPHGKVVLLTIRNDDPTPMEFEAKPFKIEKPIKGNSSAVVRIKVPEEAGKILFVDEPREDKTLGYFIVE